MIVQLNPPIPLETPKGRGMAHIIIDYSTEHSLIWQVFIDATGESWLFRNEEVRLQPNWTFGRREVSRDEILSKEGIKMWTSKGHTTQD